MPEKLGQTLDRLFRRLELDKAVQRKMALVVWDKAVGREIACHTRPLRVRDRVLFVAADSPVWAQQLLLLKNRLLARLNQELSNFGRQGAIRDLRFSPGVPLGRKVLPGDFSAKAAAGGLEGVTLSPQEEEGIRSLTGEIRDPSLRSAFQRCWEASLKRRYRDRELGYRTCSKCAALHEGQGDLCPVCRLGGRGHPYPEQVEKASSIE